MAPMNAPTGKDLSGKLSPASSLGLRDFPLYLTKSQKGALHVPEEMSSKDYQLLKTQLDNYLAIILATSVATEVDEKERSEH